MNLKKGDTVSIIYGKDKGKRGKILKVLNRRPKNDISETKIIVEGVNISKKAVKPSQKFAKGGIITKEMPLFPSKVMLVCPICNQPTRTGKKLLSDGKYSRICKKCGELVDRI